MLIRYCWYIISNMYLWDTYEHMYLWINIYTTYLNIHAVLLTLLDYRSPMKFMLIFSLTLSLSFKHSLWEHLSVICHIRFVVAIVDFSVYHCDDRAGMRTDTTNTCCPLAQPLVDCLLLLFHPSFYLHNFAGCFFLCQRCQAYDILIVVALRKVLLVFFLNV